MFRQTAYGIAPWSFYHKTLAHFYFYFVPGIVVARFVMAFLQIAKYIAPCFQKCLSIVPGVDCGHIIAPVIGK